MRTDWLPTTMSLRKFLRNPFSLALAVTALGAAWYKRSKSPAAADDSAPGKATSAQGGNERMDELTRLTRRLLIVTEDEKSRIARDLHDGLGSTLTAVNLDLFWVQQRLADQ